MPNKVVNLTDVPLLFFALIATLAQKPSAPYLQITTALTAMST